MIYERQVSEVASVGPGLASGIRLELSGDREGLCLGSPERVSRASESSSDNRLPNFRSAFSNDIYCERGCSRGVSTERLNHVEVLDGHMGNERGHDADDVGALYRDEAVVAA